MKKLILLRHGSYNENDPSKLNQEGIEDIKKISKKINSFMGKGKKVGYVSNGPKSKQSSEIISKYLDTSFEKKDLIGVPEKKEKYFIKIINFLNSINSNIDLVFLVSNGKCVEDLPYYFGKEVLGVDFKKYGFEKPDFARGFIIDLENKSLKKIK